MNRLLALLSLALLGCNGTPSSNQHDQDTVEKQQSLYAVSQPIPMFQWSQDRANLIQIYEQKNEARSTYAVVRAQGTGEIVWHCPSIGFPLPADTQLTNPLAPQYVSSATTDARVVVVEQAEPNGLFSSKSTDGTYVLCVSPDGSVSPQYTEQKVDVFTRPVKVEGGKVVFLEGNPSMKIEKKGPG